MRGLDYATVYLNSLAVGYHDLDALIAYFQASFPSLIYIE